MSKVIQIKGRAVPVVGDDIDTDRIIPARYLKEITFSKMGQYPFYDERFTAEGSMKDHPFNKPEYQGASILVANVNFGCGSSREHAPQALVRWGIRAIVAESFGEIFAGNCAMLGTPAVTASKADVAALQKLVAKNPATELVVDLEAMVVRAGNLTVKVSNARLPAQLPDPGDMGQHRAADCQRRAGEGRRCTAAASVWTAARVRLGDSGRPRIEGAFCRVSNFALRDRLWCEHEADDHRGATAYWPKGVPNEVTKTRRAAYRYCKVADPTDPCSER